MIAATYSDSVSLGNLLVAIGLLLVSAPAGVIAWRSVKAEHRAKEVAEIAAEVRTLLAGDQTITPRTPSDPSMVDLLTQVRDNTRRYVDLADDLEAHTTNPDAHRRAR